MTIVNIEQDRELYDREIENLNAEVCTIKAQLAKVEQGHSRAPALVRLLEKWLTIGAVKQAEWLRFRLGLNERELVAKQTQKRVERPAHSVIVPATETAREKMARMLTENPAELSAHIKRVYKPLIEAEEAQ